MEWNGILYTWNIRAAFGWKYGCICDFWSFSMLLWLCKEYKILGGNGEGDDPKGSAEVFLSFIQHWTLLREELNQKHEFVIVCVICAKSDAECWRYQMVSSTWGECAGSLPCVWPWPGSSATSASGRDPNRPARWDTLTHVYCRVCVGLKVEACFATIQRALNITECIHVWMMYMMHDEVLVYGFVYAGMFTFCSLRKLNSCISYPETALWFFPSRPWNNSHSSSTPKASTPPTSTAPPCMVLIWKSSVSLI